MKRALALATILAGLGAIAIGQQPQIQNGRVETRSGAAIDREVATLAAGATDPTWVGWRVPMVDGERSLCCTYSNDYNSTGVRGCFVENSSMNPSPSPNGLPQIAAPTGPVSLEAGTGLVMLLRLVDKRVERVRTLGDDCPLDAGGRTVYWLTNVTPADSLKYLESLLHPDTLGMDAARNLTSQAISAIGLHRDAAADAILDRLATNDGDPNVRRQAATQLGANRGAHGFDTLRRLIAAETSPDTRRQLVNSLGQTRQPQTAEALLNIARRDDDPKIRAEAVYWVPQRGGTRVIADVTAIIENDAVDAVKTRAVDGLARLNKDDSVPLLIQMARANKNTAVRKQAVTRLGDSKDPRALAFLEEILKR